MQAGQRGVRPFRETCWNREKFMRHQLNKWKAAFLSTYRMLFEPIVPSCTSCLPIANMASRNRSAIKGAVTKFIGNLNRTQALFLPLWSSVSSCWKGFRLRGIIWQELKVFKKESESHRGTQNGIWKGKSTTISIHKGQFPESNALEALIHLLVTTKTISVMIDL